MFEKVKQLPVEEPVAKRGSSVGSFFLPVYALTVLLIVAVCAVGSWSMLQRENDILLRGLATTAGNVAQLFEARVSGERALLGLLAEDAELIAALAAQHDLAKVQERLKQQLAAADVLMVIPAKMEQEPLQAKLGSYLALNLYERAVKNAAMPAVEALKTASGSAFMIAVPIKQQQQVLGALFARYKMEMLDGALRQLQLGKGVIGLEQVVQDGHLVLAGSPGFRHELTSGTLPVKNTLWQIGYGMTENARLVDLWPLAAMVAVAALLIYILLYRQQEKLVHAIKLDMESAVSIADAAINRAGSPVVRPRITDTAFALDLLGQYARATYAPAKFDGTNSDGNGLHAAQSSAPAGDELPEEIFLANDIRGVSGQTLTPAVARQIGMAVGTLVLNGGDTSLLIGRDARSSSDELASALSDGILSTGCDVLDLGLVPVPLLYFATRILSTDSCVMVTGGHNPKQYNGFKIVIDGMPLAGRGLRELNELVASGYLRSGNGSLQTQDVSDQYIRQVTGDIQLLEPRKVVVDGGNGAAGPLLVRLLQDLGCEVVDLYCDPDGEFPHHFPDPANAENLSALALEVQAQSADFGVALDGDGDRLALVDEKGEQVATDFLFMLLAADIIQRQPGADIIYDVKSSSYLASYILSNGGRPVMGKTGHALMKIRMQETGALLGGEYSGHFYIKDRWFGFDDALYATARLLELFSMSSQPVSRFFTDLPKGASTGTLELEIPEKQAELLLHELAQQLEVDGQDVIHLDGLRIEHPDGWALIRLSNTLPRLVFRFEGKNQAALEHASIHLHEQIKRIMPELVLPF